MKEKYDFFFVVVVVVFRKKRWNAPIIPITVVCYVSKAKGEFSKEKPKPEGVTPQETSRWCHSTL